jgi:hypothetical protein
MTRARPKLRTIFAGKSFFLLAKCAYYYDYFTQPPGGKDRQGFSGPGKKSAMRAL